MRRRWLAVAVTACVLLAGCGSPSTPATPENPQTTLTTSTTSESASTSVTTEPARASLRVGSESSRPVEVRIRVAELAGATYHEANRTLSPGEQLSLDRIVEDRTPVEVTVEVASDSATRELFVGEGLTFVVVNASSLSVEKIEYSE